MLKLTVGLTRNPRFEPLIDGTVKPKNLDLQFLVTTPPELFYRNLKYNEFDVFEMSISEFIITKERSDGSRWQWSALPIFPAKALVWLGLYVNTNAGINDLGDLKGKRVGIPDYVMTAALWFRSFLKELYAIKPQEVFWCVGRAKQFSHGMILGLDKTPPPGIALDWLSEDQTFDVMLDRGELDAAYGFVPRHDPKIQTFGNIDRYGGTPYEGNPRLAKLFADGGRRVVSDYYQKTGVIPANHMIAVQKRILEEHPWLALELVNIFRESKLAAYERARRWRSAYLLFEGEDHKKTGGAIRGRSLPVRHSRKQKNAGTPFPKLSRRRLDPKARPRGGRVFSDDAGYVRKSERRERPIDRRRSAWRSSFRPSMPTAISKKRILIGRNGWRKNTGRWRRSRVRQATLIGV